MNFIYILLLSGFLFLPFASRASLFPPVCPNELYVQVDSLKYRGYRLELTDFELVKEKNNWLKISFTAVNSGRMNIDMGREGTEHWVLINFDKSIFAAKLGGFRENIKQQLIKEDFTLEAGKSIKGIELKIPNVLPTSYRNLVSKPVVAEPQSNPKPPASSSLAWDSHNRPSLPENAVEKILENAPCADILFTEIKIIDENEKWATIQYTILNQGEGLFYLYGKKGGKEDNLAINAFISGVTTLTRGAIPIGGQILPENSKWANELKKGESITSQMKLDVRKKTRYMKSLILSLDSYQFADECDRANNHLGVVLR